jgi:hypothetical protein
LTRIKIVLESELEKGEVRMNSIKHPRVFDPLDLEIIDRVYETAWAQVEAREPFRDRGRDGEREEALRKLIFAFAGTGRVDFDNLCDSVLANMPEQLIPAPEGASQG